MMILIPPGSNEQMTGEEIVTALNALEGENRLDSDSLKEGSTNLFFSTLESEKLAGIEESAEVNLTDLETVSLLQGIESEENYLSADYIKEGSTNLFLTIGERNQLDSFSYEDSVGWIFNPANGEDLNFKVKSKNSYLLIDSGLNRVGWGVAPSYLLDIKAFTSQEAKLRLQSIENKEIGLIFTRDEQLGSYNSEWIFYIPEDEKNLKIQRNSIDLLTLNFSTDSINLRDLTNILKRNYFGYSGTYRYLQIGDTSGNVSNIAFGVDLSGNTSSAFSGNGSEIFFRSGIIFGTPNSANTAFFKHLKLTDSAIEMNPSKDNLDFIIYDDGANKIFEIDASAEVIKTDGFTTVTGSFVDNNGNTITVKNGLITGLS